MIAHGRFGKKEMRPRGAHFLRTDVLSKGQFFGLLVVPYLRVLQAALEI